MKERTGEPSKAGQVAWRSVRYAAVCCSGYAFGLVAGSLTKDRPTLIAVGVVGVFALLWVFRSGRNSVLHAAADATAAAIADARAQAKATNVVQIGNGSLAMGEHGTDTVRRVLPARQPDELTGGGSYPLEWDENGGVWVYRDSTGGEWTHVAPVEHG